MLLEPLEIARREEGRQAAATGWIAHESLIAGLYARGFGPREFCNVLSAT